MAVPMEILLHMDVFLYTEVIRVLLGPEKTRVPRRRMEPVFWGVSVVN